MKEANQQGTSPVLSFTENEGIEWNQINFANTIDKVVGRGQPGRPLSICFMGETSSGIQAAAVASVPKGWWGGGKDARGRGKEDNLEPISSLDVF